MNKYDEAFKKMCELDYEDLEELLKDGITQFKIKAYGEGYEQGKFDAQLDRIDGMTAEELTKEVQQDRRDRIIEKAKKDIEELRTTYLSTCEGLKASFWPKESEVYGCFHVHNVDFIINTDKRTVGALSKTIDNDGDYRGIAKAHPNECFHSHIGRAIALRRALGLEVRDEYLNAPQPTEVRVGDVVDLKPSDLKIPYTRTISKVSNDYITYTNDGVDSTKHVYKNGRIIDDSREEATK